MTRITPVAGYRPQGSPRMTIVEVVRYVANRHGRCAIVRYQAGGTGMVPLEKIIIERITP